MRLARTLLALSLLMSACSLLPGSAEPPALTPLPVLIAEAIVARNGEMLVSPIPLTQSASDQSAAQDTPSPTKQSTATPMSVVSDLTFAVEVGYVIRGEQRGGSRHLAIYTPGNLEPYSILDGCPVAISRASDGRVAVIMGVGSTDPECRPELATEHVLYIIDLLTLTTQRITALYPAFGGINAGQFGPETGLGKALHAIAGSSPQWSPNGRYLAFLGAIDSPNSDLYLYDTLEEEVLRLSDGPQYATQPTWSSDNSGLFHVESRYAGDTLVDHALWWTGLEAEGAIRMGPDGWPGEALSLLQVYDETWLIWNPSGEESSGPIYLLDRETTAYERSLESVIWASWVREDQHTYLLVASDQDPQENAFSLLHFHYDEMVGVAPVDGLVGAESVVDSFSQSGLGLFLVNAEDGLVAISLDGTGRVISDSAKDRLLIESPGGNWVAVVDSPSLGPAYPTLVFQRRPDGLALTWSGRSRQLPGWSPDGSLLLLSCESTSAEVLLLPDVEGDVEQGCPLWRGWGRSALWPEEMVTVVELAE